MRTCPQCQAELPDDADACEACGATLEARTADSHSSITDADYDPEEERERFERRYGIDIGDQTVDEYLQHLSQQDYSLTAWVGLIAVAQVAGVGFFVADQFADADLGVNLLFVFSGVSILLSVGVFADTRAVRQFRPWAKIRWTYILIAAIPLVGHIGGFLYLLLRRLVHEQTAEYRRRLLDAGFDVHPDANDG